MHAVSQHDGMSCSIGTLECLAVNLSLDERTIAAGSSGIMGM